VPRLVFLIDQHRVALREGAALGVLARQADRMAFEQQRAERQRLGGRQSMPSPVSIALARASRKRWIVL